MERGNFGHHRAFAPKTDPPKASRSVSMPDKWLEQRSVKERAQDSLPLFAEPSDCAPGARLPLTNIGTERGA